jgi:hypothetical protein
MPSSMPQLCGYDYDGSCAPGISDGVPLGSAFTGPEPADVGMPDTAPVTDPNVGVPTQQLGLPDAGPPAPVSDPNAPPPPAQGPCQSGAPVAADGSCGSVAIPLGAPGNPDQPLPATNVPQNAPQGDMDALTNPPSNGQIPAGSQDVAQNGRNDASGYTVPLAPGAALPGTDIPVTNTDYSVCGTLPAGVKQNCLENAYYQSHQGTSPPVCTADSVPTGCVPAGWQPATPYVAPVAPPDINSLPVGTEVSTIPLNPDGTQQAGWVADAQAGPNYGHYIRQTDAAASGCINNTGDALTACINQAMATYADNNGIGVGANLNCLNNPSRCPAYVPSTGGGPSQTNNGGNSDTHTGTFYLNGQAPGQIPGSVPAQ